jgi:hypothetical protein
MRKALNWMRYSNRAFKLFGIAMVFMVALIIFGLVYGLIYLLTLPEFTTFQRLMIFFGAYVMGMLWVISGQLEKIAKQRRA